MYYIVTTKDLRNTYAIQFFGCVNALKEKMEKGHGLLVESILQVSFIQYGMCQKRIV